MAAQVIARLSRPEAVDLLRDHDRPDAAKLHAEAVALRGRLDALADDYAEGIIIRSQLKVGTAKLRTSLATVEAAMAHTDRSRVLDGVVGADDVAAVWEGLDLDRQRAIIGAVVTVTLMKNRPGGNNRGIPQPLRKDSVILDWLGAR